MVTIIIMVMVIILAMVIIITLNYDQVMSKEQLYDLFQQILNVKKFEHQLLYNAMQVVIIHTAITVKMNCSSLLYW